MSEMSEMSGTYSRRRFLRSSAGAVAGLGVVGGAFPGLARATRAAPSTASGPVTLQWTNRWDKANDTHYLGMNYVFRTFKKKYPHINIKETLMSPGSTNLDVLKDLADCQAGGCPDMMNDMNGTFWTDGYLLDFTPYLNADPAWKKGFNKQALAFTNTNGHQWGLCDELSPLDVYWNGQLLEQAGVSELPRTWNQLTATFDKIKSAGKQPASWTSLSCHWFHALVAGQPGGLAALAKNDFGATQIYNAFVALKEFVDNGWLASDEISQSYPQAQASFQAGQIGCFMDGIWSLKNTVAAAGVSKSVAQHAEFSGVPALKGNKVVVENRIATTFGISKALEKNPAKLKAALTFAKYFFSEPVAAKWAGLCWDTMGVNIPGSAIKALPTLPSKYLKVTEAPNETFVLPATPAMQAQMWADAATGLQTLLTGKGADAAQTAYVTYLAKYK